MAFRLVLAAAVLATGGASLALAEVPAPGPTTDHYHVTESERVACQEDAIQFCAMTYPDEDRLLTCMKQNRQQLTPACLVTFEAGLKRRHIPF